MFSELKNSLSINAELDLIEEELMLECQFDDDAFNDSLVEDFEKLLVEDMDIDIDEKRSQSILIESLLDEILNEADEDNDEIVDDVGDVDFDSEDEVEDFYDDIDEEDEDDITSDEDESEDDDDGLHVLNEID